MYFSHSLIRDLVLHMEEAAVIDLNTVQNLVYHLKLPGDEVAYFIACTLAELQSFQAPENLFSRRLAFGVAYDSLEQLSPTERFAHQAKLCKQVHKISLALQKLKSSAAFTETFDGRLSLLFLGVSAASDLAHESRVLANGELSAFVERLLEAFLAEGTLFPMLLERLAGQLRHEDKTRLRLRTRDTIREGLHQLPLDESSLDRAVHTLEGPIRFREGLVRLEHFRSLAEQLVQYLNSVCH